MYILIPIFHYLSPTSKKIRDWSLVVCFTIVSIVFVKNSANNVYREECINSLLPPATNIFQSNVTIDGYFNIVEYEYFFSS